MTLCILWADWNMLVTLLEIELDGAMKKEHLHTMAGVLWLGIGLMLATRGVFQFLAAQEMGAGAGAIALAAGLGLVIGFAKGRFVLSKTARKNKNRIAELPDPVKPWQVFSVKFYPLIAVMMGMGIGIRHFFVKGGSATAQLSYGGLLCGIGGALFISAFVYWGAFEKKAAVEAEEAAKA